MWQAINRWAASRAKLVFDRNTASRWASRLRRSTRRFTTPMASGKCPRFHAVEPIPRGAGSQARVPAESLICELSFARPRRSVRIQAGVRRCSQRVRRASSPSSFRRSSRIRRPDSRSNASSSAALARPHVPITVNHQGQFPVVTLSFNLAPGASLGDAVKAVNKVQDGDGHAADRTGRLSGHGPGLPDVAGQRAGADCGGADYGLSSFWASSMKATFIR